MGSSDGGCVGPGVFCCRAGIGCNAGTRYRSGRDETICAECMSADDRRIGTDAGSAFYQSLAEFFFAAYEGAGIVDVREHTGRTAENIGFQFDAFVECNIVLDLTAVANYDRRPDHHVLAERAILADYDAREDVDEMPYLGRGTDLDVVVNVSAFVDEDAGEAIVLPHLVHPLGRPHPRHFAGAKGCTSPLAMIGSVRNAETISTEKRTSSSP